MRIECEEDMPMLDAVKDIQPLTAFKRDSAGMMKRMKKTGRPLILTVNGKAEAVLLDAAAYREIAEHLDTVAHIRQGLVEAKRGLGRPVDELFDDLAAGAHSG
jgi:prevent-host-death family protein